MTRKPLYLLGAVVALWTLGCDWNHDDDDTDETGDDDSGATTDDDDVADDDSASDDDDAADDDAADDDTDEGEHAAGFGAPEEHGLALKEQQMDCRECHGADLTGDGDATSCDDCHEDDWRTNCTYCHGGLDNSLGSPAVDLHDNTATNLQTVGAHTEHVTQTDHPAFDCTQCHVKPTEVLSGDHVFDATPVVAEVTMTSGMSSSGSYTGGGCTNLYCHGYLGQDNGGAVDFTTAATCASCHPDRSSPVPAWDGQMSGKHRMHLEDGVGCSGCHLDVVDDDQVILDPSLHVNGSVEIALAEGLTWTEWVGSCSGGSCHGEHHGITFW
jgi:hypothetical protein